MADLGYSPVGAGFQKAGDLLLQFLMGKMQSDLQQKQLDKQNTMEQERLGIEKDRSKSDTDYRNWEMLRAKAQDILSGGPLSGVNPDDIQTLQKAGMGGRVSGNAGATPFQATPNSGDTTPDDASVQPLQGQMDRPKMVPMGTLSPNPTEFYVKPTELEKQQLADLSEKQSDSQMRRDFLSGLNPNLKAKAMFGVDPSEPDYKTKFDMGNKADIEKIKLEHSNRMEEIAQQARDAQGLGDKTKLTELARMWMSAKPDRTLEETDPTVRSEWVKMGVPILRSLGMSVEDIKSMMTAMGGDATAPSAGGLGNLPSVTSGGKPPANGPGMFEKFLSALKPADGGSVDSKGIYRKPGEQPEPDAKNCPQGKGYHLRMKSDQSGVECVKD